MEGDYDWEEKAASLGENLPSWAQKNRTSMGTVGVEEERVNSPWTEGYDTLPQLCGIQIPLWVKNHVSGDAPSLTHLRKCCTTPHMQVRFPGCWSHSSPHACASCQSKEAKTLSSSDLRHGIWCYRSWLGVWPSHITTLICKNRQMMQKVSACEMNSPKHAWVC